MKQSPFFNEMDKDTSNYTKDTHSNLTHRINETKNDSFTDKLEGLSLESVSRCELIKAFDFRIGIW